MINHAEVNMKRTVSFVFAVLLFLCLFAAGVSGADVLLEAEYADGFSENSGKLGATVTNLSNESAADVTLEIILPDGVSAGQNKVTLTAVAPGESVTKDFILTFEKASFFATHKALVAAAAIFVTVLIVFIVTLIRKGKKGGAKSAALALLLIPAALLASTARAGSAAEKKLVITHGSKEYEIVISASARDAETSDTEAGDDLSFPAPAQDSEPAVSHALRNDRKTDENADYNTPRVAAARLKEGAGPLGDERVYIGKNDFMFYGEEIDCFSGKTVLDDKTVEQIGTCLCRIDEWAKENGIDLYLLICPDKSTVYADYVPEKVVAANETSRTLLTSYLAKNTDINVIDSTNALISARKEFGDGLFYKYDTHWTQHGGYVAYKELIKAIRQKHPETVFYDKSYYDVAEYETYMKDNAYYLGYYDAYTDNGPSYSLKKGPEATLTRKRGEESHGQFVFCALWENGFRDDLIFASFESVNKDAPKAYVLRDSFSIAMFPFMKESFSTSSYLWAYSATSSQILGSGANVLVIEVVERSLADLVSARLT